MKTAPESIPLRTQKLSVQQGTSGWDSSEADIDHVDRLRLWLRIAEVAGVLALLTGIVTQMVCFLQWLMFDRLFLFHHMAVLLASAFAILAGTPMFLTSGFAEANLFQPAAARNSLSAENDILLPFHHAGQITGSPD